MWMLHEKRRENLPRPWKNGTLLLMDFKFNISGVMVSGMEKNMHQVCASPGLYMTELFEEDYCLGSVWVFPQGMPGSRMGSKLEMGMNLINMRFMTYQKDTLTHTLLTCPISEDTLIFTHMQEVDGRHNMVTHGMLNRKTVTTMVAAVGVDKRYCNFCILRNERCECSSRDVVEMFENSRENRRRTFEGAPTLIGVVGNKHIKSWLEGSWGVQLSTNPDFRMDIVCNEKGLDFDRSITFVIQSEMMVLMAPANVVRDSSCFAQPMETSSSESVDMEQSGQSSENLLANNGHHSMNGESVMGSMEDSAAEVNQKQRGREHRCKVCAMSFPRSYNLRRHITSVHEKKKNYQCRYCTRTFSQTGHLNEHIRTVHQTDSALKCPLCSKCFGAQSKLSRHVNQVHLDIRMPCGICTKSYKDSTALKEHYRTAHRGSVTMSDDDAQPKTYDTDSTLQLSYELQEEPMAKSF